LPPGYHIECLVEDNVHIIKVTTPTGVTSVTDGEQLHLTLNNTKQPQERKEPIEFNHAITFVNKIKSQFANEPEVYKQFLDILQDYQKNQKPIQEVILLQWNK
jgi:paired amphipathic helix protein Sin3a